MVLVHVCVYMLTQGDTVSIARVMLRLQRVWDKYVVYNDITDLEKLIESNQSFDKDDKVKHSTHCQVKLCPALVRRDSHLFLTYYHMLFVFNIHFHFTTTESNYSISSNTVGHLSFCSIKSPKMPPRKGVQPAQVPIVKLSADGRLNELRKALDDQLKRHEALLVTQDEASKTALTESIEKGKQTINDALDTYAQPTFAPRKMGLPSLEQYNALKDIRAAMVAELRSPSAENRIVLDEAKKSLVAAFKVPDPKAEEEWEPDGTRVTDSQSKGKWTYLI